MKSQELLICECNSKEHQMIFDYDDEDKTIYCSIHLCKVPFWKRVTRGIKYIFGYKCKYGNFEEVLIHPGHIDQFRNIIFKLEEYSKK